MTGKRKPLAFAVLKRAKKSKMTPSKVRKIVQRMSENNYRDEVISTTVDSAGTITHLTPIVQGDTSNNRIGQEINSQHVSWNITFTGADSTNVVRMIIFGAKYMAGLNPTVANVLETANNPHSFLLDVNKHQYFVLYDKMVSLSTIGENQIQSLRGFVKIPQKYKKVMFNEGATTPRTNHLFLLLQSDSGAVAHPGVVGILRYRFQDP